METMYNQNFLTFLGIINLIVWKSVTKDNKKKIWTTMHWTLPINCLMFKSIWIIITSKVIIKLISTFDLLISYLYIINIFYKLY